MPYDEPFLFLKPNNVVIKTCNGSTLRCGPVATGKLVDGGGKGKFAQWHAEFRDGHILLKNSHSGKYMRIHKVPVGHTADVKGTGGPHCPFKIHKAGKPGHVKLESVAHPGCYIAVRSGNVTVGTGGPFCLLEFYRE